jgi:parvulin-like peptidyl-prolyl isomerase
MDIMPNNFTIAPEDILLQVKLSCQVLKITEEILSRHIIMTEASKVGIEASNKELQQAADRIRIDEDLRDASATLRWLEQQQLSVDDFEQIAMMRVLTKKLSHHLFLDKIESFFSMYQLDYAGAILYEVVVENGDLALELYYAVCTGEETFANIARRYSQDLELRRIGGYLGKRARKEMDPAISAAVFAATPPQVLKPILTARGFHLVFVEELVQPLLNEEIRLKILTHMFNEWLQEKLSGFTISYLP